MQGDEWTIHRDTERGGSGGGGHAGWSSDDSDYGERSGSGSGDRGSDYWDGRRKLGGVLLNLTYLSLSLGFSPFRVKISTGAASICPHCILLFSFLLFSFFVRFTVAATMSYMFNQLCSLIEVTAHARWNVKLAYYHMCA